MRKSRYSQRGIVSKKPRPDQKEIIEKTVAELSRGNRATVVMPCGSGKTLTALWIIERMKFKTIVVFAPTLGVLAPERRGISCQHPIS